FETPGRTFWPGDDPYWEAVDIYYAATFDYEWYSPEAVNTSNGALVITMEEKETHNLNFRSGMLQSWNKFCFQGGYIEFAIKQPGAPTHQGYWPAAWLMGNLGRAGYLGSTQGTWPYSYQSCDTGILDRQQFVNGSGPEAAINSNAIYANKDGTLSSLPGMRMSACTCPGEDHAGPNVNVGRSAPELDILEAQFQNHDGSEHIWASQSMQTAPFDVNYQWGDGATQAQVYDPTITEFNSYVGSPLQQCVSSITQTPDRGFQLTNGEFVKFGLDYSPDWDNNGNGYVTWYVDGKKTWTVHGSALGPNPAVDIGRRPIPTEPMSIIMNLGIAQGFQPIKWTGANSVVFPAVMEFDYVRVYQRDGQKDRITCDPEDHPTADYIARHPDLYYNPNITTYSSVYGWPKNRIKDGC
ncbi:beta-glucan synthesis-associated, partial [Violaceomyces palustris]